MRTSTSHPLKIDEVSAGAGMGKIGITFCPGKKQKTAHTGEWNRDLSIDLSKHFSLEGQSSRHIIGRP